MASVSKNGVEKEEKDAHAQIEQSPILDLSIYNDLISASLQTYYCNKHQSLLVSAGVCQCLDRFDKSIFEDKPLISGECGLPELEQNDLDVSCLNDGDKFEDIFMAFNCESASV